MADNKRNFAEKLHPGYPSRTPTKGSTIPAEVIKGAEKGDCAIPPNTLVFVANNQSGNVTQVQATHPRKKRSVAGVSIGGVEDPIAAPKFRDSAGRFGIVNAGQGRMIGRKYLAQDRCVPFKCMDHVYVNVIDRTFNGGAPGGGTNVANNHCGFNYAGDTSYLLPVMIDGDTYDALDPNPAAGAGGLAARRAAAQEKFERVGTVVGRSNEADLLTIELKIA